MICFIDKKIGIFKRLIVEFATPEDIDVLKHKKCDVILSFNMFAKEDDNLGKVPTWILFYDKIESEEQLYLGQHKNIRNSYNYCVKEEVEYFLLDSSQITKTILKKIKKMCDTMYKMRNIKTRVNLHFLYEYVKHGNLIITYSKYKDEICCYHVYAVDKKHARLWYSCSLIHDGKRNDELYSKINRFCHYNDILFFYRNNFYSYDLGGVNSFDNPDGRAKFKMQFMGESFYVYQKSFNIGRKAVLYNSFISLIKKII